MRYFISQSDKGEWLIFDRERDTGMAIAKARTREIAERIVAALNLLEVA